MTSHTSIGIPVPMYLKKYLEKRYGTSHKISKHSSIGLLVIEISTRRYIKPVKKQPGEAEFRLLVTENYYKKKVHNINRRKLNLLTSLMVKLFYEDMVHSLSRKVAMEGIEARPALVEFLKYYDITEEDLKVDTAYMQYRRRVKKSKPVKI